MQNSWKCNRKYCIVLTGIKHLRYVKKIVKSRALVFLIKSRLINNYVMKYFFSNQNMGWNLRRKNFWSHAIITQNCKISFRMTCSGAPTKNLYNTGSLFWLPLNIQILTAQNSSGVLRYIGSLYSFTLLMNSFELVYNLTAFHCNIHKILFSFYLLQALY